MEAINSSDFVKPSEHVSSHVVSVKPLDRQAVLNGEVHNWYRSVLGYSDQLVTTLLDRLSISGKGPILDPFCGTGTTLVECMKRGVSSVGIDANPAACYVAAAKTTWRVDPERLLALGHSVGRSSAQLLRKHKQLTEDATYRYILESGMLRRGWISRDPLLKAIAIKRAISNLGARAAHRRLLMLALLSEVTFSASNVRFGPELYCGPAKSDIDVYDGFSSRLRRMADDLRVVREAFGTRTQARVSLGDARALQAVGLAHNSFDAVISSPPYPAEHDYTRQSRLELAFLEEVCDLETLRQIKRRMIRSNTKNIYVGDCESMFVANHRLIKPLLREIRARIADKEYGFARYYPSVIGEYFGGMRRHLQQVKRVLRRGATAAYVVGDQCAYAQVHIPTAQVLEALAHEVGLVPVDRIEWRLRRASITSKIIVEHIVLVRKR